MQGHQCMFSRAFTTVTVTRCSVTSNGGDCTRGTIGLFGRVLCCGGAPNTLRPGFERKFITGKRSFYVVLVSATTHVQRTMSSPILAHRVSRSVTRLHHSFVGPRFGTVLRAIKPGNRFVSSVPNQAVGPNRSVRAT